MPPVLPLYIMFFTLICTAFIPTTAWNSVVKKENFLSVSLTPQGTSTTIRIDTDTTISQDVSCSHVLISLILTLSMLFNLVIVLTIVTLCYVTRRFEVWQYVPCCSCCGTIVRFIQRAFEWRERSGRVVAPLSDFRHMDRDISAGRLNPPQDMV